MSLAAVAGAATVTGTFFQLLATVQSYRQGLIQIAGQQEQLGYQNDLLQENLDYVTELANLELADIQTNADYWQTYQELGHRQLESEGRVIEANKEALATKMQSSADIYESEMDIFDTKKAQKEADIEILDSQKAIEGSKQKQIGQEMNILSVNDAKARTQLALQRGDVRLARAEATKEARVTSAQTKMLLAAGGASAFTKAYAQMSVNTLSSFDQKFTALEQEGLFNKKIYQSELSQLKESQFQSRETQKQLGLEQQKAQGDIDILGEEASITKSKYKAEKAGQTASMVGLNEAATQLSIEGAGLDAQVDRELGLLGTQQERVGAEVGHVIDTTNIQTQANNAAIENLEQQASAAGDPAQGVEFNDTIPGQIGGAVTQAAGSAFENISDVIF